MTDLLGVHTRSGHEIICCLEVVRAIGGGVFWHGRLIAKLAESLTF